MSPLAPMPGGLFPLRLAAADRSFDIPIEIWANVGAGLAAGAACEPPQIVRPAMGADRYRMATMENRAIDQDAAHAHVAHLAERDLREIGIQNIMLPIRRSCASVVTSSCGDACNLDIRHQEIALETARFSAFGVKMNNLAANRRKRTQMTTNKRKRGAQPANQNAVKHGRFRASVRAERRAAALAAAEEHRISAARWAAQMPSTDYAAIVEGIGKN
jgi:hypothetical protein